MFGRGPPAPRRPPWPLRARTCPWRPRARPAGAPSGWPPRSLSPGPVDEGGGGRGAAGGEEVSGRARNLPAEGGAAVGETTHLHDDALLGGVRNGVGRKGHARVAVQALGEHARQRRALALQGEARQRRSRLGVPLPGRHPPRRAPRRRAAPEPSPPPPAAPRRPPALPPPPRREGTSART